MRVAPRRRGGGGGGEEAADGEVGRAKGCTICQRLKPGFAVEESERRKQTERGEGEG